VLYLTFGDAPGGAEIMLSQLLRSVDRQEIEAHVLVASDGAVADLVRPHAARVIVEPRLRHILLHERGLRRVLSNTLAFLGVLASLSRRIRRDHYDLVHAVATPAFKYGGITARIARIPALATLYEVLDDRLISPWSRRLLALNLNAFYERILVPSEASRRSAIQAGLKADRIVVFENGIDVDGFRQSSCDRHAARSELGLDDTIFAVGVVGRLIPLKGQDVALRALAPLIAQRRDVSMVIVGGARTGDEAAWQARLRSLAAELGVAERVIFTGWRNDVGRLYAALDCLVHTPVLPDASPTVLIEAMAAGVPCVASDIGGIAEIVSDGENGLLVPPSNMIKLRQAVETMLTDAKLRSALIQRAGTAVSVRFDRHARARQLEAVYRELCATHGPAR
jgi:glycosyltransferase involved in cell wall biosynthesis